jgi:DNA-binding SARP family transcriptional activator
MRRIASDALRALARLKERRGDRDGAARDLERLTELDPFDVDVHRDLLVLLLRLGHRTEAARRYETLRYRMLTTFGEGLDFTLADVMMDAA